MRICRERTSSWIAAAAVTGALAIGSGAWAHEGEGHDEAAEHAAGPQVTLQGEVLDMQCFMVHPDTGQGADHAKCAQTCIAKGSTIGFKAADGTVYLLLGEGHDSAKKAVGKLAGLPVSVTGVVMDRAGVKAFMVHAVKRAGAAAGGAAVAKPAKAREVWVCPMHPEEVSDKPGKCPKCGMDYELQKK